jgi:hypothetical protein
MGIPEKCDVVACKSTSDFWVSIYDSLISYTLIVKNIRNMKVFAHKKYTKYIQNSFHNFHLIT